MKKRICILTKSYKHGGYCVAGIDIETKEWIRLVNSDNPNTDEIGKEQMVLNGKVIDCLDVLEYDFIKNIPNLCQTENWLLNNSISPKFIKSISIEELAEIVELDSEDFFICNKSNLLNDEEVLKVKRSLYMFHVQNLRIEAVSYEHYGEIRFRYKCIFEYKGNKYKNISLTDPIYRDVSQDGLNWTDALIIASLPCVPYSDGSFYKFVAKIIPIDKQLVSYIESMSGDMKRTIEDKEKEFLPSPFVKYDIVVEAQQTPGVVLFENYEQLKASISKGVSYYSNFEYTIDNYQLALKHHNELKHVKNALEKTKREIVKSYNAPLETVEQRIEELINLIKVPFKKLDTFIKQNEKESKRHEILKFARTCALSNGLCEHLENVLNSPAFFDTKWLNSSCSRTTWRSAVLLKIKKAVRDIDYILSLPNDNIASILAHYYQTLSIDMVKEFIDSLQRAAKFTTHHEKDDEINNTVIGETQPVSKGIQEVGEHIEVVQLNTNSDINYSDYEILSYVANSINPYTGEVITGVEEGLSSRLFEIAKRIERNYDDEYVDSIDKRTKRIPQFFNGKDLVKLIIDACNEISKVRYFGVATIIGVLRGSKEAHIVKHNLIELKCYGILSAMKNADVFEVIKFLLEQKFLYKTGGLYPIIKVNHEKTLDDIESLDCLQVEEILKKSYSVLSKTKTEKTNIGKEWVYIDGDADPELLKTLRSLRNKIANERFSPVYIVAKEELLLRIATVKPLSKEEFLKIKGIGERWFELYGEEFLVAIRQYIH